MATPSNIKDTKPDRYKCAVRMIGLIGRDHAGKSVFINELRHRWGQQREPGKFEEGSRSTVVEMTGSPYSRNANKQYHLVEIPGFMNEPLRDGDGAVILAIAKFLVQVYEDQGFAGLVYLHDCSQDTPKADIQREMALLCAIIGPTFYDHTALVLNKFDPNQFSPEWTREIGLWWPWTIGKRMLARRNGPPRGEPRPIVELIWETPPDAFSLIKELVSGKKLCDTTVGKVYKKLLEKEIDKTKHEPARREALKEELKTWKKCKVTYKALSRS